MGYFVFIETFLVRYAGILFLIRGLWKELQISALSYCTQLRYTKFNLDRNNSRGRIFVSKLCKFVTNSLPWIIILAKLTKVVVHNVGHSVSFQDRTHLHKYFLSKYKHEWIFAIVLQFVRPTLTIFGIIISR